MDPDACDLRSLDLEKAEGLRRSRPPLAEAELLSEGYRALADPTRLTLAITLARTDELCVCDLAWISERSENLVSHHLRILRRAGLVSSRRDGKMVIYSIAEEGRHLLGALVSDLEAVN